MPMRSFVSGAMHFHVDVGCTLSEPSKRNYSPETRRTKWELPYHYHQCGVFIAYYQVISVTPGEMEKGLVLHKGHSPVAMPETARPQELGPITPHTPSPIDLGHSRQCGIAQTRPIIRAQEGCLSQPHKGAAQMGGCLFLPSKQGCPLGVKWPHAGSSSA